MSPHTDEHETCFWAQIKRALPALTCNYLWKSGLASSCSQRIKRPTWMPMMMRVEFLKPISSYAIPPPADPRYPPRHSKLNQRDVTIPFVCSVSGTRPDLTLEDSIKVRVVMKHEATPNLQEKVHHSYRYHVHKGIIPPLTHEWSFQCQPGRQCWGWRRKRELARWLSSQWWCTGFQ